MQQSDEQYGPWIAVPDEQSWAMRHEANEVREAEREMERAKLQLRRAMLTVEERKIALNDQMIKAVGGDLCVEFEPGYRRYRKHLDCAQLHGSPFPQAPAWVADILKEISEGGKTE